jgi:hypothetical protein
MTNKFFVCGTLSYGEYDIISEKQFKEFSKFIKGTRWKLSPEDDTLTFKNESDKQPIHTFDDLKFNFEFMRRELYEHYETTLIGKLVVVGMGELYKVYFDDTGEIRYKKSKPLRRRELEMFLIKEECDGNLEEMTNIYFGKETKPSESNKICKFLKFLKPTGFEDYTGKTGTMSQLTDLEEDILDNMKTFVNWGTFYAFELKSKKDAEFIAKMMIMRIGYFTAGFEEFVVKCLISKYIMALQILASEHMFQYYMVEDEIIKGVEKMLELPEGSIQG